MHLSMGSANQRVLWLQAAPRPLPTLRPSAGWTAEQTESCTAKVPCYEGNAEAGTGDREAQELAGLALRLAHLGAGKLRRIASSAPPERLSLLRCICLLRSMKMFPIHNINIPLVEIQSSSKFSHPITILANYYSKLLKRSWSHLPCCFIFQKLGI